ncbi:phenylalanyl-tRNA synthetase [Scenedesmus sp. NREL 46B-D3]|nr:phenylalanyl-tRNA synthetase [Scenedesmus sp. NREL 46B-D3]
MPIVGVNRDRLFEALGRKYTDEEFDQLCFEYGIELDDVTSEREMIRKELSKDDHSALQDASEDVIYKIDIPANRYDMLCLEGIARALNIFKGRLEAPQYRLADMRGKPLLQLVVKPETALIRPYVVAAVLRGVTFDATRYTSFIDLQDKLHQNLCRQRSLVAIGTHDLAKCRGPFTYEALPPADISFVPLKQTQKFRADELMDHYLANDQKLKKYVPLIKDSLVYPAIYDADRTLLSLPPIINGAATAISLETRDVFIECTATDLTKAKVVLNTVCAMFSEFCSQPYVVEPVEVLDSFGDSHVYPDLAPRQIDVPLDYINSCLGLQLEASAVAKLLRSMQLQADLTQAAAAAADADGSSSSGASLLVSVPPTRSDVLHACDVMEDVAIAYGYNNLSKQIPTTVTQGRELPLNQVTELLRQEVALSGYTEILTWALCSRAENFDAMRCPESAPGAGAVAIGNPQTAEFEVCRTTLLPSALKTIAANKREPLPLRLFELSDVVLLDAGRDVGARNERRLVAVHCGKASEFEVIHGLLDRVMQVLNVPREGSNPELEAKLGGGYSWAPSEHPSFFPGRQAVISARGQQVGAIGIVHPEVLAAFDIEHPVSALELNIQPFVFDTAIKSRMHDMHGWNLQH